MELHFFKPSQSDTFTKSEIEEMKEMYDEAVFEYYQTDNSTMHDLQFDELKEILESNGYNLSGEDDVESDNVREKLTSSNNMISLKKVQVFTKEMEQTHVDSIISWLKQYDNTVCLDTEVAVGWKLDGCASSLRYDSNNQLQDVVTRGNFSIAKKMLAIAKTQHPVSLTPEIRCEMLMKKTTFIDKSYDEQYANPRNLVSGIINDINIDDSRKFDITFLKVNDGINHATETRDNVLAYDYCKISELPELYKQYLNKRSKCEYPTDGLVVYLKNVESFECIGKYPLHSIAIKFPPVEAITTILDIQWNLKKSGEWIPKAILEPVDLDGSMIRKSLIFNIGYIRKNSLYPGATVVIAKNGDIIPYIQRVVEPGNIEYFDIPNNTFESGIHLYPNDAQEIIDRERFIAGCYCLGIKGFGYSWFYGMSKLCNSDIINVFDYNIVNVTSLKQIFGGSKKQEQFIASIFELKNKLTIYRVLRMLQIPHLGNSLSKQIARHLSGLEFDSFGLERKILNECISGIWSIRISEARAHLEALGINVELVKDEIKNFTATFEMTGSPKEFGITSKEDFCKLVPEWLHTKLDKSTSYLITDDKTSTTGKMAKAKKLGTKVITYSEAIELYKK